MMRSTIKQKNNLKTKKHQLSEDKKLKM